MKLYLYLYLTIQILRPIIVTIHVQLNKSDILKSSPLLTLVHVSSTLSYSHSFINIFDNIKFLLYIGKLWKVLSVILCVIKLIFRIFNITKLLSNAFILELPNK